MDSSIVFDLKQVNTRNKLQISQAYVQYHIFLYDQPNSRSKVSLSMTSINNKNIHKDEEVFISNGISHSNHESISLHKFRDF